jgi:Apoptosis-antagonizing transcription factor, C-terminal
VESAAAALDALAAALDAVSEKVVHSSAVAPAAGFDADDPLAWQARTLDDWAASSATATATPAFKAIDTRPSAQLRVALDTGRHLERARKLRATLPLIDGSQLAPGVAAAAAAVHYDDGELYRALLREVIDSGDAPGGGLRYALLARTGRVRKKVDRRANKGRKLRYVTHEKLVGFLAPVPLPHPGPVDEIIAGLFGAGTR